MDSQDNLVSTSSNTIKTYQIVVVTLIIIVSILGGVLLAVLTNQNNNSSNQISLTQDRPEESLPTQEIVVNNDQALDPEVEGEILLESEKQPTESATPSENQPSEPQTNQVKVIYDNFVDLENPQDQIFIESTTRSDLLTFAIEKLIAGYTPETLSQGFSSRIRGESDCGGKDFQVTRIQDKVVTIRFCREVWGIGSVSDISMLQSIEKTATQFNNIDEAIVLEKNGECLFFNSFINNCKSDVNVSQSGRFSSASIDSK